MVIGLAIGSSLTPFVPLPFVDDWIYERLLRRVAVKVLERNAGLVPSRALQADEKAIAGAYLKAGDPSFGTKAATTLVRFAIRKVAMVLDVKKSHDVFGEAIAFALALDAAIATGKVTSGNGEAVGIAIYNGLLTVGSGLVDAITRAGREAFAGGRPSERISEAFGKHVDEAYGHLSQAMAHELR
jgi:hypothetical protein